jgi:hypothetical protein
VSQRPKKKERKKRRSSVLFRNEQNSKDTLRVFVFQILTGKLVFGTILPTKEWFFISVLRGRISIPPSRFFLKCYETTVLLALHTAEDRNEKRLQKTPSIILRVFFM